jgi:hypothetical protein
LYSNITSDCRKKKKQSISAITAIKVNENMVLETQHPWTFINILIINYVMSARPNSGHWTCIQEILPFTA